MHLGAHYYSLADFFLVAFSIWQIMLVAVMPSGVRLPAYWNPYLTAFGLYLIVVGCSAFYAGNTAGVLKQFSKWAEIGLISAGVVLYARDARRIETVYWAAVCVMVGIIGGRLLANVMAGHPLARIFSPVDWLIVLLLPFIAKRWVQFLLVAFSFPALIIDHSRLSWASTALAVFVFLIAKAKYVMASRHRRRALATLGLGCVILLVAFPRFPEVIWRRVTVTLHPSQDQSAFTRKAMARVSADDFIQHPLLGIGAGNFKHHVLTHQSGTNFWISAEALPNSPHSVMLQTAAELGLFGLLTFVALLGTVGMSIFGSRRCTRGTVLEPYSFGLMLMWIPLGITLLSSTIGDSYRVVWGIYLGTGIAIRYTRVAYVDAGWRGAVRAGADDLAPRDTKYVQYRNEDND